MMKQRRRKLILDQCLRKHMANFPWPWSVRHYLHYRFRAMRVRRDYVARKILVNAHADAPMSADSAVATAALNLSKPEISTGH